MIVYAFDRDHSIDVNPHPNRDAVPLEWVVILREREDTEVWAIGNQQLKTEANIPGVKEAQEKLGIDPNMGPFGVELPPRRKRLRLLNELYPSASECIVVDDVDLSNMDGWMHYYPWDFYKEYKQSF